MWLALAALVGILVTCVLPFYLVTPTIAIVTAFVIIFYPFKIPWIRRRKLWETLRQRLNYTVVSANNTEANVNREEQLVFAVAPHGPFCLSIMLTWVFETPTTSRTRRHREVIPMVAKQLLRVPLLGALCRMHGCQNISSDNFRTQLSNGKSIAMAPGGAKEAMFSDELVGNRITILRRRSYAWTTHAMFNNTNIIPVLSLGECSAYRTWRSFRPLQRLCYRLVGYPFPIFIFGAFWSFWPRSDGNVKLVVGKKIKWNAYDNPQAMADAYYAELERLAIAHNYTITWVEE